MEFQWLLSKPLLFHWKSMEFKITLLFHCYSSCIPIKISVTFPLVLFHWYSTVFIIKIPMEFHWYFFHLICHKIPLLFQRSYAYQWLFFQFYLVNIFPLSFQRKAVKYHCNFEGHICEMSIRVIKPVTCPLVCFSLLVSHINATLNCQPLLHGKKTLGSVTNKERHWLKVPPT